MVRNFVKLLVDLISLNCNDHKRKAQKGKSTECKPILKSCANNVEEKVFKIEAEMDVFKRLLIC